MTGRIMTLCFYIIKFVTSLLPLKKLIVLESSPDLSDNTYMLYLKLIEKGYNKKYKFVWILNQKKKDIRLPENVYMQSKGVASVFEKFKAHWTIARAKYIIDSNVFIHKVHKNQIRIHLKHGLPLKDASFYTKKTGDVDLLCVPSEYWIAPCVKEHNVPVNVIKPLGFPRNDVLKPKEHKHKTVIWMPTYRKNGSDSAKAVDFDYSKVMPYGLPFIRKSEDLVEINELFARNDAYLLIRLHPAEDVSGMDLNEMSNIRICDNTFLQSQNISLYSLLNYTDALISDFSSIYYDYLLLDKPVALATADFEQYKKHNGILAEDYNQFKEMFPAVYLENPAQLKEFFNNVFEEKINMDEQMKAREKYMGKAQESSADSIIDYLEKNFSF